LAVRLFCSYSRVMGRVVVTIIAVGTAAMAATLIANAAHDDYGIPLEAIRIDALGTAGFIVAALACGSVLRRKK
jgi:hypothetical protein